MYTTLVSGCPLDVRLSATEGCHLKEWFLQAATRGVRDRWPLMGACLAHNKHWECRKAQQCRNKFDNCLWLLYLMPCHRKNRLKEYRKAFVIFDGITPSLPIVCCTYVALSGLATFYGKDRRYKIHVVMERFLVTYMYHGIFHEIPALHYNY